MGGLRERLYTRAVTISLARNLCNVRKPGTGSYGSPASPDVSSGTQERNARAPVAERLHGHR